MRTIIARLPTRDLAGKTGDCHRMVGGTGGEQDLKQMRRGCCQPSTALLLAIKTEILSQALGADVRQRVDFDLLHLRLPKNATIKKVLGRFACLQETSQSDEARLVAQLNDLF